MSYSSDDRNFTVLDPNSMTFRETIIDGKQAHIIDFPETQANTFLVYTTYTKNFVALPGGTSWFQAASDDSSYMAYNKTDAEQVFFETPTAVRKLTGDIQPQGKEKNSLFVDMGETVAIKELLLTPDQALEEPSKADFEFLSFNESTNEFEEIRNWSVAEREGRHVFSAEDASPVTARYLLLRRIASQQERDYFGQMYIEDISVLVDPYAGLEEANRIQSLETGLTRGGFAHNASYLPNLGTPTQSELWALIAAGSSPEEWYRTALKNGVGTGWAYRVVDAYALDASDLRQSMLFYWSEAKNVSRLQVSATRENSLRVGTGDFYVAYSNDNFTTYRTLSPDELTVTQDVTADNYPSFTIDFQTVRASHVILYTKYSLGAQTEPGAGQSYFMVHPKAAKAYFVGSDELWEPDAVQTLSAQDNPFDIIEDNNGSLSFGRPGTAVGLALDSSLPLCAVVIRGQGEDTVSDSHADYSVYKSEDNESWTLVSDYAVSKQESAGETALQFEFTKRNTSFVKVLYQGAAVDFRIADIKADVLAFSFTEKSTIDVIYKKNATIGFLEDDRVPSKGPAGQFGSTVEFSFDSSLKSMAADLEEVHSVNYIKLYDTDTQNRLAKQDLSIYVSGDNISYTKIEDFSFHRDGREIHLYNFSASGRYIKVHQSQFETSSAIADGSGFEHYATFTGQLQNMMAVYDMPLFTKSNQVNSFPYGQGHWDFYKDIRVENNQRKALSTNLFYMSYEALGLPAILQAGKAQAEYADVRFADQSGNMLPYYDDGSGFYVRLQNVKIGSTTVTMYYGNELARSMSDGEETLQVDFAGKTYGKSIGGDCHMAMLPDGRMAQIAHTAVEDGVREVFIAFSEDNGQTFGPKQKITDTPNHMAQAGGVLVLPDGELMVTYIWMEKNGGYGAYMDPTQTNMQVYALTSKNNVTEWNEPVLIEVGSTYCLATTNPIQASDGSFYLPVAVAVDNAGAMGICVMRSQDGGQTWENVSGIKQDTSAHFEGGYSEPSIVELTEGVLRVFFRQGAGPDTVKLGQITSQDNGESWTDVEQSEFYATCTQPVTHKLPSGRILLLWAGHNGTGSNTYQRMPVTLVYSDDGGETWEGWQELSGRTLFNLPFGHPMALQPDFCFAPDGSLTVMIWMRGTIYAPDGSWFSFRLEDFDRWMEENTGAFDDFEQASAVKGNYWYEMGPRVGISEEKCVSGRASLRVADNSQIDTAMAVRNFMGVKKGRIDFSFNYIASDSGLQLGLWECMPVFPENAGNMFTLDVSKDGRLSYVNADGALVSTGVTLRRDQWYDVTLSFDAAAKSMTIAVDGIEVGQASCTQPQNVIAYFAAYSTGIAEEGTEFYLDNFIVIDAADTLLRASLVNSGLPETEPGTGEKDWDEFDDVKEEHWFYDVVKTAFEMKLMDGTAKGKFQPDLSASRGMVITTLWRLEDMPLAEKENSFVDVPKDAWYDDAISWGEEANMIAGYGNNQFGPDDLVTREQMVTILWRYFGSPTGAFSKYLSFRDSDAISSWAEDAVAWAVEMDLLDGKGGGILDSGGQTTRCELAALLTRMVTLQ